jgi:AraC-like DNA-binding protein
MSSMIPAWNGQCLLANGGWLFVGRTSRELKVCFPAMLFLIPDQAQTGMCASPLARQTIPGGFSGQIVVIDAASELSRALAGLPFVKLMEGLDAKESSALAQQCIDRRDTAPYLQFLARSFDLHIPTGRMLQRQCQEMRLGAMYDRLNAGLNVLTASESAQVCGLSPSRFSLLFKQDLGMCYPDYAAFLKFRNYLFESRLVTRTQQLIASAAGFYDISHASRAFQKSMSINTYDLRGLRVYTDQSMQARALPTADLNRSTKLAERQVVSAY